MWAGQCRNRIPAAGTDGFVDPLKQIPGSLARIPTTHYTAAGKAW